MEQLSQKDSEYVKALKKQNDDIDELIENMKDNFKTMRMDYADRLTEIEGHFNTERQKILQRNKKDIQNLFNEQKKLEIEKMEEKARKEEEYTRELEQLRTNDAND